ncbi:MAG: hypothetical protein ABIJ37_06670 [Pseudomonadota bacterium]
MKKEKPIATTMREIRMELEKIYKERKSWNGAKGSFTAQAIKQRELILIKQQILYRLEDANLLKDKGEEAFYIILYKIINEYLNYRQYSETDFKKV